MKFYIAGKWTEKNTIQLWIKTMQDMGHVITHNWTLIEESDKKSYEDCARFAEFDVNGVRDADVLIIVITDPSYPYRGTCCELGIALALNKQVMICNLCPVSPAFRTNIFTYHPLVKWFDSAEKLVSQLKT